MRILKPFLQPTSAAAVASSPPLTPPAKTIQGPPLPAA